MSRKVLSPSFALSRGLWLVWFLRSGSCSGLVGRNQLWHSCTNGPFTGQINQAAPSLGNCPESTVWRESHLTPVHWLKGASIITAQHSPCHLLFLCLCLLPLLSLLLSSLSGSPLLPSWFLFSPPGYILLQFSSSSSSHALLLLTRCPT